MNNNSDFILESQIALLGNNNILRGEKAMKKVISTGEDEIYAMYREDIGWIAFVYGKPGSTPPNNINSAEDMKRWIANQKQKDTYYYPFKGGSGISHIIAKRDWEGKWIKGLKGQKGKEFALSLVKLIGNQKIKCTNRGGRILLSDSDKEIYFKKDKIKGCNVFLLTGYKIIQDSDYIIETGNSEINLSDGDRYRLRPPTPTHNNHAHAAETMGADKLSGYGEYKDHQRSLIPTHTSHLQNVKSMVASNGLPDDKDYKYCSSISTHDNHSSTVETMVAGRNYFLSNTINSVNQKDNTMAIFENIGINTTSNADRTKFKNIKDAILAVRNGKNFSDVIDVVKSLYYQTKEYYDTKNGEYGLQARGKRTREKLNAQCREILDRIKGDPSLLKPEDIAILKQYSGKGGTSEGSEFEYYTPAPVAEGTWDALKANGFENGSVLDPCCGAGIFEATKPEGVVVTGCDIDETSSSVARILNPKDKIQTKPFEQLVIDTPDEAFDSVISNVPFGDVRGPSKQIDKKYQKENQLERYFILRALDKIKPGGLACFICPTTVVGTKGNKTWAEWRRAVSRKAEFLGAHKLPSKTFNAQGTDTVVDVVVFRKHGRDLLGKIEDLPIDVLQQANVYWDEFIKGKYWIGEGKKFIQGKYIPKVKGDRFSREQVLGDKDGDGKIDNQAIKRKLAVKFHSRINWELLDATEPVTKKYIEGDMRSIDGVMYKLVNGEWEEQIVEQMTAGKIDKAEYGASSVEELTTLLASQKGGLSISYKQAVNAIGSFSERINPAIIQAVKETERADESIIEQFYRGCLIGSMIQKAMEDATQDGVDITTRLDNIKELVSAEFDKYGDPKKNAKLKLAGTFSRSYGLFMNATDKDGNFSAFLSGKIEREETSMNRTDNISDIVMQQFVNEERDNLTLADIKELYTGKLEIQNEGDLAKFDDIAISPDGCIMPMGHYCSGNGYKKIKELNEAIATTSDSRLKDKYQKQIDMIYSRLKHTPIEQITFTLQQKWFGEDYLLDFLHNNGYPYAHYEDVFDKETGKTEHVFKISNKNPKDFDNQLEKYINGEKISGKKENIRAYDADKKDIENAFNDFMKNHVEADNIAVKYNMLFNSNIPEEFSGENLGIDDILSGEITPHTYQNAEVRRLSATGCGICGFGVGLGKSFTALALAGYQAKKGHANRTCIVVPGAVLENWYHEARTFYSKEYMDQYVFVVGLEPVKNKDGDIEQIPILDEKGKQKEKKDGSLMFQDKLVSRNSAAEINQQMWSIPQSNYKLVVMSKEKFQDIPVKKESVDAYIKQKSAKRTLDKNAVKELEKIASNGKEKKKSSYAEAKSKLSYEGKISETGDKKERLPYFDELGFDNIITDETHFYKNSCADKTKLSGVKYLPQAKAANIALDMAMKSELIRAKNGGKGVFGLSATPVTNSPLEVYNILSLVMPEEEFEAMGINGPDTFLHLYAKIEKTHYSDVSGEDQYGDTLVGFQNLDGLRSLFSKYVTMKSVKDVNSEIHVPEQIDVEETVPIVPEQKKIYDSLKKMVKQGVMVKTVVDGQTVLEKKKIPIFSIIRQMDKVTTDLDMYNKTMTFVFPKEKKAEVQKIITEVSPLHKTVTGKFVDIATGELKEYQDYFPNPKLSEKGNFLILTVEEHFEKEVIDFALEFGINDNEISHPIMPKYAKLIENIKKELEDGGKQIVFTEEKTQHEKLKRIIAQYVPLSKDKIDIINGETADGTKLDAIAKAYNSGSILVVIANKKAEVGVNLQKGTTAIHHLTFPWTPASINQRNGRGVRQGNKSAQVRTYNYYAEGTFDNYRKQLLDAKKDWLDQILTSNIQDAENGNVMSQDDIDILMADNPEEAKKRIAEAAERKRLLDEANDRKQIFKKLDAYKKAKYDLSKIENDPAGTLKTFEERLEEKKTSLKTYKENGWKGKAVNTLEEEIAVLKNSVKQWKKYNDPNYVTSVKSALNRNKLSIKSAMDNGKVTLPEDIFENPESYHFSSNGTAIQKNETFEDQAGKKFYIYDIQGKSFRPSSAVSIGGKFYPWGSYLSIDIIDDPSVKRINMTVEELEFYNSYVIPYAQTYYRFMMHQRDHKEHLIKYADKYRIEKDKIVVLDNGGEFYDFKKLTGETTLAELPKLVWSNFKTEEERRKLVRSYLNSVKNGADKADLNSVMNDILGSGFVGIIESYAMEDAGLTEEKIKETVINTFNEMANRINVKQEIEQEPENFFDRYSFLGKFKEFIDGTYVNSVLEKLGNPKEEYQIKEISYNCSAYLDEKIKEYIEYAQEVQRNNLKKAVEKDLATINPEHKQLFEKLNLEFAKTDKEIVDVWGKYKNMKTVIPAGSYALHDSRELTQNILKKCLSDNGGKNTLGKTNCFYIKNWDQSRLTSWWFITAEKVDVLCNLLKETYRQMTGNILESAINSSRKQRPYKHLILENASNSAYIQRRERKHLLLENATKK